MTTRCRKLCAGALAGLGAGDSGEEAALAQVGDQPREPGRAGRAEARLRLADQVGQRVLPVEQLEQLGVGIGQAQVAVALEVAQDPAARALLLVQALERVARAHPRADAELRGLGGDAVHAVLVDDERGARAHDDRAARLGRLAPALDGQLLIAEADQRPVAQQRRADDALAVQVGAMAGAGVLDPGAAAVGGGHDARVRARHGRVGDAQRRGRRAADQQVLDQRHAVAAGEHELERRLRAVQRRAAAPAERSAAHHLAAAVRAQHARAPYSTVSGWNAGLSPSSRSDR